MGLSSSLCCVSVRSSDPMKYKYWPAVPGDIQSDPPEIEPEHTYHVFLCGCQDNTTVTSQLAEILMEQGFMCCDMGGTCGTEVEIRSQAILQSRVVIAIITKHMSNKKENWVPFEMVNTAAKAAGQDKILFIPVLHEVKASEVPIYIKEMSCLETKHGQFWPDIFNMITNPIERRKALPVGNIAHGLCWSHYYGYLAIILPSLRERTLKYELYHPMKEGETEFIQVSSSLVEDLKKLPILPKLISVVPMSGQCQPKFLDENIRHVGLLKLKGSRAGKNFRDYDSNLHEVTDPKNGKKYLVVLEYPNAISILAEMERGRISKLNRAQKETQLVLFTEKIREIVDHPNNRACNNSALFVLYGDNVDKPEPLASVVAEVIRNDPDLITPVV